MTLEEKRYEFITSQITYRNEKVLEALAHYVTLLSAIAGGVFWLRTQST